MAEIRIIPETIQLIKMSDEEYFSEKYRGYISNSRLSLINPEEEGSFEKFTLGFEEKYSDSFALGSAVHAKILQPDEYIISDILKPGGKLGIFAEHVYNYRCEGFSIQESIKKASLSADYYSSQLSPKRVKTAIKTSLPFYLQRIKYKEEENKKTLFLSAPVKYKFTECMKSIEINSSKILETLYPAGLFSKVESFNEYAILCEVEYIDEDTGEITPLKLKGKLDNFTIDHDFKTVTLNDLKTSGKKVDYFMGYTVSNIDAEGNEIIILENGSFQKYRYYRQLGMYLWLLQSALKQLWNLNYSSKVNILVIETVPDFNNKVFSINNMYIKEGIAELKKLLTLVVEWKKMYQI